MCFKSEARGFASTEVKFYVFRIVPHSNDDLRITLFWTHFKSIELSHYEAPHLVFIGSVYPSLVRFGTVYIIWDLKLVILITPNWFRSIFQVTTTRDVRLFHNCFYAFMNFDIMHFLHHINNSYHDLYWLLIHTLHFILYTYIIRCF